MVKNIKRSLNPAKFLTEEEKKLVEEAIKKAERKTSGEIKVYIDRFCWDRIEDKAARIFKKLKLDKTKERNAVLIYLVTTNREFLIYGDEGIHKKVGSHFWEDVKNRMVENFKEGNFGKGIADAVEVIGEKLKNFFPYKKDDINEISDEIEYGKEE